jgi:hypothetical protein
MFRKLVPLVMVLVFVFSLILSGCGGSGGNKNSAAAPRGITGTITSGKSIVAASSSIPASGGIISVTESGSPIAGMKLTVPAGAYKGTQQFNISYAPIEKQSFGAACNPLTPMISVDSGSTALSDEIMDIKVPVKVPAGQFAMGFIYDTATKQLQGMTTIAQDANSITIGVRHFCNFFISSINEALLKKDIDSGFKPGVDDWQFQNRGSFLAKGGHCAGQSATALWYYVTQPDGAGQKLYGRYDNNGNKPATPAFWQDDSLAYRFVSVVHDDINWDSFENKFWSNLSGKNDAATFNLFAYSMQLTGEPQEVGIFSKAGGGHDMICYRIKDGQLYIADPNYPGNIERRIEYHSNNSTFTPYNSGANAEEIAQGNGKAYETIEFCTKGTTIGWDEIADRWTELKNKTIGDDEFPAYTLVWRDDKGVFHDLKDGFASPTKLLCMGAKKVGSGPSVDFGIYRDGVRLIANSKLEVELKPGINKLGFWITKAIDAHDKNGNPIKVDKYIDFKYLNISYNSLVIDPATMESQPAKKCTFTAKADDIPAGTTFEWLVDGKTKQKDNNTSFSISFPEERDYAIMVRMLDKDGKEVATAEATASIKKADNEVKNGGFSNISLKIGLYASETTYDSQYQTTTQHQDVHSWTCIFHTVSWNGASFTATRDWNDSSRVGTEKITGQVAANGSLTFTLTQDWKDGPNSRWQSQVTFTGIPAGADANYWQIHGPELLKKYLTSFSYRDTNDNGSYKGSTSVLWEGLPKDYNPLSYWYIDWTPE